MENITTNKKPNLDTVKNITTKTLIEEFLKKGGEIKICKPKKLKKTWSDFVRGGRQRIGNMSGGCEYAR
tara:strand:+ start:909 stop:1115 length:207 start_codon:yes stop_codon:yes gene_type:complete